MLLPNFDKIKNQISFALDFRSFAKIIVMVGLLLLLSASFGRVVTNARSNFDVYEYERESLATLESERHKLQKDLDYHQSYEYKKLYARDYLNMVEPGERLYRVVNGAELYDIESEQYKYPSSNYMGWWLGVF